MSFFKRLFGFTETLDTPEKLLMALLQASKSSPHKVDSLCKANIQVIQANFKLWQKVPDEIRKDPNRLQEYFQMLLKVAQSFQHYFNDHSLMDALVGTPETNPLLAANQAIDRAAEQMKVVNFEAARSILVDVLISCHQMEGSGRQRLLAIAQGNLGACCFQLGRTEEAIRYFGEALKLCREDSDQEGIEAYLNSLFEAHRYLGNSQQASEAMRELAAIYRSSNRPSEAKRSRIRAEIVAKGEPLVRMVMSNGKETFELNEMDPGGGTFYFERNRLTLVPCESLTKEARKCASEGHYDAAASMLENAKKLDLFDPHCRYELGYVEMLRERYNEAINSLEEVERLAPGWYQVRANLWLANELLNGRLPQKVLIGLQLFECIQVETKDRLRVADDLAAEFPGLGMMHLERGKLLFDIGRQEEAEQAFLRALEYESDPDTRSRILSQLACVYEPGENRNSYARQTLEITNGNLMAECIARLILQVDESQTPKT